MGKLSLDAKAFTALVPKIFRVNRLAPDIGDQLTAPDGLIEYRQNPHHRRAKLMAIKPKGAKPSNTCKHARRNGPISWPGRIQ